MFGLQQALEEMQDLSLYINEVKRDNEALALIQEIQNSIVDLQMVRMFFFTVKLVLFVTPILALIYESNVLQIQDSQGKFTRRHLHA